VSPTVNFQYFIVPMKGLSKVPDYTKITHTTVPNIVH